MDMMRLPKDFKELLSIFNKNSVEYLLVGDYIGEWFLMRDEENEKDKIKSVIRDFFMNQYNLIAIYLFGSFVRDDFGNESDVDIALLMNEKIDNFSLYEWQAEISVLLNRDFDLVDLQTVLPGLSIQVLKSGVLLYCKDDEQRLFYEMRILREYQELNEEREVALKGVYGDRVWKLL